MPHVLLRNPGTVALDLEAKVALLEQDRAAVAAQHGVPQSGLQPVPPGGQRAGDVADVLVVHAEHGAEPMLLHHRSGSVDAVFPQAVPVDALLPVHAGDAEIGSHGLPLADRPVETPTAALLKAKYRSQGAPRK